LAGAAGESHGDAVLHVPWRYLEGLLGASTELTTRIRARTHFSRIPGLLLL
jgi:hypothetical protein